MAPSRTVAVTGSTGFVGRNIVRALLSRGWTVHALCRDRAKARDVLPADAGAALRIVEGEFADAPVLAGLLAGCRATVHAVGILRESGKGQTFERVHTGTTRALVNACRASGVRRLVHISALGVHDEGRTNYQRSKFEAEQIIRRSDLDWTILRPSLIHGPEGEFIRLARGWVSGHNPPWTFLPYFSRAEVVDASVPLPSIRRVAPSVQPVAVEDVARAVTESLERPESIGEVYPLVGAEALTWPQLLRHIRDHTPGANGDLEPRALPAEPAAAAARAARHLGLGALLPFDEGMALNGAQDSTGSPAKAAADLGFTPRSFRDAYRAHALA